MPNITVSTDVDNFMQSADNAAMRDSIELGLTDTVEFGALEISKINFPNLTTSELNAVTNATEGDTYFDSDRDQFVRFTGAASYDVITSWTEVIPDGSTISDAITLTESRLFESGAIGNEGSGGPSNPDDSLKIFGGSINNSVTTLGYFRYSATGLWYDLPTVVGAQTGIDSFTPGKMMRIDTLAGSTFFDVRRVVSNTIADNLLVTKPLKTGVSYVIEARLNVSDLDVGNLRFDAGYTGSYASSSAEITMRNVTSGETELDVNLPFIDTDEILAFGGNQFPLKATSPFFGFYTFRFVVTPASDGVFTLSTRQVAASIEPLFIGKGSYTVTATI